MKKTWFGLYAVALDGYPYLAVRKADIENLPFFDFWLESSKGSGGPVVDGVDYVWYHDWDAFVKFFMATGSHRFKYSREQSEQDDKRRGVFGVEVIDEAYVRIDDIKALPFYDFFAQVEPPRLYIDNGVEMISHYDWASFCSRFLKEGTHRWIEKGLTNE